MASSYAGDAVVSYTAVRRASAVFERGAGLPAVLSLFALIEAAVLYERLWYVSFGDALEGPLVQLGDAVAARNHAARLNARLARDFQAQVEGLIDDGFSVALPIPPIVALVLERSDARTGPVKRSGGRAAG